MQAALSTGAADPAGPHRRPGWAGWLLLAPMLAWLALFVVVPTTILLTYSLGHRGEDTPVELGFSAANYLRVLAGTEIWPLLRCLLQAAGVAAGAMVLMWLRSGDEEMRERVATLKRVGVTMLLAALLWNVWSNLEQVFTGTYVRIFARSVYYAGATTVMCIIVGYPVAYFIGRAPERSRNLLLTLVMIPFWTSFLIRTYAWITILSESGLLNGFLQYTRLISEPFAMLYTPGAVVLGLVYSYLPFMILPIYGSAEKLDHSLVEAAFDLGAGPVRVFREVILPLTRPGIVAGVLLVFVPAIGMFAVTDLMGGKTVPMIGNVIQDQFVGQGRDWPFGAALGISLLAFFGAAFLLSSKREGMFES